MLYIIDVIILEDIIHKKDILVYDDILNSSDKAVEACKHRIKMPEIQCPIPGCEYVTADVDASVAASLLLIHNNVHLAGSSSSQKQKPPR